MEYKSLEPTSLKTLNVEAPSFTGATASFFATSQFVYMLLFVAIIVAAFYRYALAGVYRMEASEAGIRKSNEVFKKVTLGLLGVFSLFLILFTVNKGLITGDITLDALRVKGVPGTGGTVAVMPGTSQGTSGGASKTCEAKDSVISKLTSSDGLCGGAQCTVLSGCNYQQYLPLIINETDGDTELAKMVIVTMCKESRADKTAQNTKNGNGTFDCGLMQINQPGACGADILDPTTNIKKGVAKIKAALNSSSRLYTGIPQKAGAFASYNCCANGTVPNAVSTDCTQAAGFPSEIPKWACPINPGESAFNMCSVKSYACELSACLLQIRL